MALLAAASAQARQPAPASLVADVSQPGVVNLVFFGQAGARVYFVERVGSRVKRLGDALVTSYGAVALADATKWRCDRLVRRFEATAIAPDGTRSHGSFDVRTGSCANRLDLSVPRRVAPGADVHVRVLDRWKLGAVKPELCIAAPRARFACSTLTLARGAPSAGRRFRASERGLWRVELRIDNRRVRTQVAVGTSRLPPAPPVVLATGDSTMQGIDNFLADGLAGSARVLSEVHVGTSISRRPGWVRRAASQAARLRPAKSVVSIGANDDSPMRTADGAVVACCGAAWSAEYTLRARAIMRSYLRGGRGRVVWLALPAPRDPLRGAISSVVNGAIRTAAKGMDGVTVLPLDQLFTPDGYRDDMRWRGQTVRVRAPDGIHLSVAGTAIAAEVIEPALGAPSR